MLTQQLNDSFTQQQFVPSTFFLLVFSSFLLVSAHANAAVDKILAGNKNQEREIEKFLSRHFFETLITAKTAR
jgi:hypothetical protein